MSQAKSAGPLLQRHSLNLPDDFSKVSGLRLNNKKTEALWIGSSIGNEQLISPGRDFKWPKCKVKTLGLWLSVKPEIAARLNYNENIEKIRKIRSCWKYRRLTLLGRITVLKSLAASQLVYLLSPMPSNYHAINEINTLCHITSCHVLPSGLGGLKVQPRASAILSARVVV